MINKTGIRLKLLLKSTIMCKNSVIIVPARARALGYVYALKFYVYEHIRACTKHITDNNTWIRVYTENISLCGKTPAVLVWYTFLIYTWYKDPFGHTRVWSHSIAKRFSVTFKKTKHSYLCIIYASVSTYLRAIPFLSFISLSLSLSHTHTHLSLIHI